MIKIKDTTTALEIFEEAALIHAEATEQGDYKTVNKCYDRITKAISFLKGEDAISLLGRYLSNSSVGVRLWAARYLLQIKEQEAVEVLEGIVNGEGIHSLDAEMTLSEWRKGNLTF